MLDVTITELDSNLSFKAKMGNPPSDIKTYSTVYIDEQEIKRPVVDRASNLVDIKIPSPDNEVSDFVMKWKNSGKRIDLMIETNERMYFLKGCSLKNFESPKKQFSVFYNSYREA